MKFTLLISLLIFGLNGYSSENDMSDPELKEQTLLKEIEPNSSKKFSELVKTTMDLMGPEAELSESSDSSAHFQISEN